MRLSLRKGFSFGLTSGVITTLGAIVGVNSSTHSKAAVLASIAAIAVADALSDAFGIHISEESENRHTGRQVWEATFATLVSKSIFAFSFIVPVLFLDLGPAVIVNLVWGLLLISGFSFRMAVEQGKRPHMVVAEHLAITVLVVVLTNMVGTAVSLFL